MAAAAVAAAGAASAFLSGLKLHRVLILISDRMEHKAVGWSKNPVGGQAQKMTGHLKIYDIERHE